MTRQAKGVVGGKARVNILAVGPGEQMDTSQPIHPPPVRRRAISWGLKKSGTALMWPRTVKCKIGLGKKPKVNQLNKR